LDGLSIVIPAWNEEGRLAATLDRCLPSLLARGEPFEVIVVVDGADDRTLEVARSFESRSVRVLSFPEKLGKGGAVLAGLRAAQYDIVGYLDADGPISPAEIYGMVAALKDCDCVIASRWLQGSRIVRQEPVTNVIAGRVWNLLVRFILRLPLQDTQCGAKFLRRSIVQTSLRAVSLTNRAFDVDLLYHIRKDGLRLKEMPVSWEHNPDSRMPIARAIPVMFLSLVGVRMMNLPGGRRLPKRWADWFLLRYGSV
jgi:glycosyltransferase involved in cell wall biosynthesis